MDTPDLTGCYWLVAQQSVNKMDFNNPIVEDAHTHTVDKKLLINYKYIEK